MKSWIHGVLMVCVATLLVFSAVSAQGNEPTDDDVNAIAKKLFCPVCENTPLDVCGTRACIDWRDEIRLKLKEGWSEQEIIDYFVLIHGAQVLSAPPAEGLNLLVYILPPVVFLIGGYVLFRSVRSWRKAPASTGAVSEGPDADDPYIARLEEELRKRA
jgi:cytochrome c-type biogenesis protein CcmH